MSGVEVLDESLGPDEHENIESGLLFKLGSLTLSLTTGTCLCEREAQGSNQAL